MKWVFGIGLVVAMVVLFLLPTVGKQKPTGEESATPTAMLLPLIDSIRRTLPPIQQDHLIDKESKLQHNRRALMEQLFYFWRDSIGKPYPVISHYYQGEWGILEKSQKNTTFAAAFFLDMLHSSPLESAKYFYAQLAAYYYDALIGMGDASDSVRVGKAIADIYGGQPMSGVKVLREMMEHDTTNIYAGKYLAEALMRIGRAEQAQEVLLSIVSKAPRDLQIILYLAEVCERLGKLQEARKYYAQVLHAAPHLPLHLQQVLEKKLQQLISSK